MVGKLKSYVQVENKIQFEFEHFTTWIEVINENVFNVFAPIKYDERVSKAIEDLKVKSCQISVMEVDGHVEIKTQTLCAKVYDEFKVDFYDVKTSALICEDYRKERAPFKRSGNDGIAAEEGLGIETHTERHAIEVIKTMLGDESFYGLGDKTGHLNKRGYAYEMWNTDDPKPHVESYKTLYKSIPFFITLRREAVFGIFFDNTFKSYFDMGKENDGYYYFGADSGNLNYYFIYGESMPDVVGEYTSLTGCTPLPQMWTLGYQQSRFSYATANRIEELMDKFLEYDIPCDVIHLDIHHMDAFKVFTFHPENYPNPEALIAKAKARGIKLVPIVDPGVKKEIGYEVYDEGIANGYFATDADGLPYVNRVWPGDALYPDFSNPKTRAWWGENHR
ncbi:MAG TPA: alpha-glucosidase, partial [Firmicutes bacterium]|nr:alpha-glucosidase [Bacillota bacterium]